jgi:hypothetical protein
MAFNLWRNNNSGLSLIICPTRIGSQKNQKSLWAIKPHVQGT